MGLIREPDGVDFYVENKPLTQQEKEKISEIIAHYKKTGKKKPYVQQKQAGGVKQKKHSSQQDTY